MENWYQEQIGFINLYCEIHWIARDPELLITVERYAAKVSELSSNFEKYFDKILESNKSVKNFLALHSVFPDEIEDRVNRFFYDRLKVENDSVYIDSGVMEKLSPFDPVPVDFETYPYRIEYGDWHDPIKVIDIDFEKENQLKSFDIREFLNQFDVIIL